MKSYKVILIPINNSMDTIYINNQLKYILVHQSPCSILYSIDSMIGDGTSNEVYLSKEHWIYDLCCTDNLVLGKANLRTSAVEDLVLRLSVADLDQDELNDLALENSYHFDLYCLNPKYVLRPLYRCSTGSRHLCIMEYRPHTIDNYLAALCSSSLSDEQIYNKIEAMIIQLKACLESFHPYEFQHGDFKYNNILVSYDSEFTISEIKLIDFGISRFQNQGKLFTTDAYTKLVEHYSPYSDMAFFILHTYKYISTICSHKECRLEPLWIRVINSHFKKPSPFQFRKLTGKRKFKISIPNALEKTTTRKLYRVIPKPMIDIKQFYKV